MNTKVTECEACSASPSEMCSECNRPKSEHPFNDCLLMPAQVTTITIKLREVVSFGKKLILCTTCADREEQQNSTAVQLDYKETIVAKIETVVDKTVNKTVERWQELYNTQRMEWLPENFESIQDMREKLTAFLIDMENLEFERRAKSRASYDAARELDAKLSKSEREALINDPNFKVPENSQFKKAKNTTRQNKDEKAIAALIAIGFSLEDAKKQVNGSFKEGAKDEGN